MQFKQNILIISISIICFITDRISKVFVINFLTNNNIDNFYYNPYLNIILTWNRGIAFGLFDSKDHIYHFTTLIIFIIIVFLIFLLVKSKFFFEKISYSLVIGGAVGNFFDRLYYSAVPDFIDLHINDFHWFTFNISDIWITIGIVSLIFFEIFNYKNIKNENNF